MPLNSSNATTLQPIFRPEGQNPDVFELYFRGRGTSSVIERKIFIKSFDSLSARTYFNAFNIYFWHTKTTLDEVTLTIDVDEGSGEILLFHETLAGLKTIDASRFGAGNSNSVSFTFSVRALRTGLVFWEVRALSEVTLADARYETRQAPERAVRLGLIITTFNREASVSDAMARFSRSALVPEGHRLFVIDNGQSLPPCDLSGVEVVPNANLGGAGGFSRGLMELRRRGEFTHCLFMDDDASTHMECIEKAVAYLAFATSDKLAIAGAMFFMEHPWIQYEAGARVQPFGLEALKSHRDMRETFLLLLNEDDEEVHYGGWWFFAFSLNAAKEYAFPFFVRGDDILFGLRHEFDTIAPSGIATWQPTFEDKISPSVEYLAHRADFLFAIVRSRESGFPISRVLARSATFVWNEASCFRYGIANARCQAMEDVLKGPAFFKENPVALPRLAMLKATYPGDYPKPMGRRNIAGLREYRRDKRERPLKNALRWLTWDGHLLPPFLARRKLVVYGLAPHRKAALHARSITYFSVPAQVGISTERSLASYIKLWWRLARISAETRRRRDELADAYKAAFPEMTSETHWSKLLGL